MRQSSRRGFHLLATTSVIAMSLSAAPLAIDLYSPLPVLKVAMAASCCFTGGTRVRMADGRERPIRDVRVGDLVMGPSGGACRVVRVEQPLLGARPLYALNGGPAFVTAEHPFATLGGWRSIDPAATAQENPSLPVKRLLVGDCLQTRGADPVCSTAGNLAFAEPALAIVALLSLKAESAAPETMLYNLLLDGEHAYFANGYLVHNKDGDSGSGGGDSDGGGESGGGDSGGSGSGGDDSGGDDSDGGESGSSGSGSSGSGSGGSDGESGESGESGSSGPSKSSGSSNSGASFEQIQPVGPDLSPSEEAEAISKGWQ